MRIARRGIAAAGRGLAPRGEGVGQSAGGRGAVRRQPDQRVVDFGRPELSRSRWCGGHRADREENRDLGVWGLPFGVQSR